MDKLKLTTAVLILGIGIGGYYYFDTQAVLARSLIVVGGILLALIVAMTSAQGQQAWEFAKSARVELRKVVWPTNKETVQVTLIVFVLVVLVAIYLWFVDLGLSKGVMALTGRGG